ncbi:MAG: hypothetical protein JWN68_2032 [Nocardioides sp.]|jgi:energy-coupling factor transport system substrate-specific component|nr:hypothetical protein [Nocardioides sp.]
MSAEQSRVGRTTVYDVFRTGRKRLDADLVADIVLALVPDEELAAALAEQCRAAQVGARPVVRPQDPAPAQDPVSAPPRESAETSTRASLSSRVVLAILLSGVAINLLGRGLVDLLGLPIYLDMVGTAISAIVLGPWWGALVGVATNVSGVAVSGPESLWFAPVNVAGALLWGYGVRRWALARSIPRFFALNVLVAVCCTVIAAPILVLALDGYGQHKSGDITDSMLAISHSLWLSVSVSNLLTSVSDKLIAGFVLLALVEGLPPALRSWVPESWMRDATPEDTVVRACSGLPNAA